MQWHMTSFRLTFTASISALWVPTNAPGFGNICALEQQFFNSNSLRFVYVSLRLRHNMPWIMAAAFNSKWLPFKTFKETFNTHHFSCLSNCLVGVSWCCVNEIAQGAAWTTNFNNEQNDWSFFFSLNEKEGIKHKESNRMFADHKSK